MAAKSFSSPVANPDALARSLAAARAEVGSPAGGLLFVSGALTQDPQRITDLVRTAWRHVPVTIVPGAGVLSERGEIEGASAAAGLLWSGGRATPFAAGEAGSAASLHSALAGAAGGKPSTVLVFPRSDFAADMLEGVAAAAPGACVFGAGTVGAPAISLTPDGEVLRGRLAGLALHGLAAPLVETASACRLLGALRPIDEAHNGMVLSVGGEPALDVLSSSMPELRGAAQGSPSEPGHAGASAPRPVVFVALAEAGDDRVVVRPVRGVDPGRRGVLVGPDARAGMRLAFAVRDAASARAGLEAAARTASQNAMGSAPRFAIYLSCAGRGQGLYGAPDVEARILRQRFGDLPIAGMHSAFELVPWSRGAGAAAAPPRGPVARLALYTGVLALFRSPS